MPDFAHQRDSEAERSVCDRSVCFFSPLNSPPVNGRHDGSVCCFGPLKSPLVNSSYDNIIFLLQRWVINNNK